jgi:formate/nitrite transporter FocA (FNT family)
MAELVSHAGAVKGNMRLEKGSSTVSASCLLSFACVTLISTMSSPWYQGNVPGLIRMLSALVIPYGLSMGFLTGASLYTDSFMVSSQICVPQMPNE